MDPIDLSHIRQAFKCLQWRDCDALASSALHNCAWMQPCCLAGEPNDTLARCLQTKTLLLWLIEQLVPNDLLMTKKQQENRAILYHRFVEGHSIKLLEGLLKIGRATIHTRTTRALKACVGRLQTRSNESSLEVMCHSIRACVRYDHATSEQQRLLRQLSVYQQPMLPSDLLRPPMPMLDELRVRGFVVGDEAVAIHPQLRAYVLAQVSAENQQRWLTHAAAVMERQGEIWQAHAYLFQSGRYSKSAELLLKHEAHLLQSISLNQLLNTLEAYKPRSLSKNDWTKLKLLAARSASRTQSQQAALSHLRSANPSNPTFRAFTELHLAIVNRHADRQLALSHFDNCLMWAARSTDSLQKEIMLEAYIRRAWLYLSDPVDLDCAQVDLEAATTLIKSHQPATHLHILMCNVEGKFHTRRRAFAHAAVSYDTGLQLANEVESVQLKILILHNLGLLHARQKQPALEVLCKGKALAESIDDQATLAHFEKALGGYYFHQKAYRKSAEHNARARQICLKIGNAQLLAKINFDLAEALANNGQLREAKAYLTHAQQYAEAHDLTGLTRACVGLTRQYPELGVELTDPQLKIIQFARQHQVVTTAQLAQHIQKSGATVQRYLKPILQAGILQKSGKGPKTVYQMES